MIRYPDEDELIRIRLMLIVLLAERRKLLVYDQQLTNTYWDIDMSSLMPINHDIHRIINKDKMLYIKKSKSVFGRDRDIVTIKHGEDIKIKLSIEDIAVLDNIIDYTKGMSWNEFIKLI